MKLRTFFTAAMAALVLATACNKENPTPAPSDQEPLIKVRASLYQFTKATDTAFEEGDEIGVNIFKGEEVYLYNASFTNTLGSFEPAVAHKWYKESDVEATITAVYPRTDALDSYSGTATFTVNADQSAKEGYKGSDLLLATTTSAPTESAVSLPFKHALSKISITIDNKLEEDIQNVWFTDVYGSVTYDPKAPFTTLAASGSQGTVKAYKSGDNTWVLIVAPQEEVAPKLALTTASGKQYTFVLAENVTFTSGKVSTATVEVKETSIYTSFTPEISDWVADNELNFSQDETDVELPEQGENVQNTHIICLDPNDNWEMSDARFVVYSWGEGVDATWTEMTDPEGDGIYTCYISGNHTSLLFCRMNPNVQENRWNKESDTDATKPLWNQSPDLSVPTDHVNCYKIAEGVWDKNDVNEQNQPTWNGSWIALTK